MELISLESKNKNELLNNLLDKLQCEENDILYRYEVKKGGLFKSETHIIKGIKLEDIKTDIIEFLSELTNKMGLKVNFESNIRNNQINIKMFSDNNPILIGKNGQTLTALQNIVKQMVFSKTGLYPYVLLDVENYKDKKQSNLEYQVKKIAKEVIKTKKDAILDDMNAYERKIVHDVLNNFKNISTESEGIEPHRHVVIKYIED